MKQRLMIALFVALTLAGIASTISAGWTPACIGIDQWDPRWLWFHCWDPPPCPECGKEG